MDDFDFDNLEPTYQVFRQRTPAFRIVLPVVVLLVVVAIVSGLVFAGIVQGDKPRGGPIEAPTTESTVLIAP